MQSSKKAAECATPLILNRILPKYHPETRVWGYYKSEGIKSNFHLYKVVEGQDSCHTHTLLIDLNWIRQFQCESLSRDAARLVGGMGGLPPSLRVQVPKPSPGLVINKHVQRRKTHASHNLSEPQLPHLSIIIFQGDYNTCFSGDP